MHICSPSSDDLSKRRKKIGQSLLIQMEKQGFFGIKGMVKHNLDQAEIKRFLNQNDAQDLQPKLQDIAKDNCSEMEVVLNFIQDLFNICVEGGKGEHLKQIIAFLDWFKDNSQNCPLKIKEFKTNNPAILRACMKKDFWMVSVLYKAGFQVETKICDGLNFTSDYMFLDSSDADLMSELSLFEAMASPPYLFAMYDQYKEFKGAGLERKLGSLITRQQRAMLSDPVLCAFRLIKICSKITTRRKINKVKEINDSLKMFTTKMLDLCRGQKEIQLFLNQTDNVSGQTQLKQFPRIDQAIRLNWQEFVNHDHCQQAVETNFFIPEGHGCIASAKYILLQLIKMPFVCIGYSMVNCVNTLKGREETSIRLAYQKTFSKYLLKNQLVNLTVGYVLFGLSMIVSIEHPGKIFPSIDENCFQAFHGICNMGVIWHLLHGWNFMVFMVGHIINDCEQMFRLSVKGGNNLQEHGTYHMVVSTVRRLQCFFGDWVLNFSLLGHTALWVGVTTQLIGYVHHPFYLHLYSHNEPNIFNFLRHNETGVVLRCQATREKITNMSFSELSFYPFVEFESFCYEEFHPVKIGGYIQIIGILFILYRILYILRMAPGVGVFIISFARCAKRVLTFLITYIIITAVFAFSLCLVMHKSMLKSMLTSCQDPKDNKFASFGTTFRLLLFAFFSPEDTEYFDDCSDSIGGWVGWLIYYSYFVVVTLVMVNLLIALMSVIAMNDKDDILNNCRYQRTVILMEFCNKGVIIPPPMNIIHLLIMIPTHICCR